MRLSLNVFFLSVLFCASHALAYVCATTTSTSGAEVELAWTKRNLTYKINSAGTQDIANTSEEFQALRESFLVWQNMMLASDASACAGLVGQSDITFTDLGLTSSTQVGYNSKSSNNENILVFRDDSWPYDVDPKTVIALTTTTYNQATGELLDADIEFNSAEFKFVIDNPGALDTDLKNAAVHEIGHFLGIAHSTVTGSTMSPTAAKADTSKRLLHCDDAEVLVIKYPKGEANGSCSEELNPSNEEEDEDDDGGCQQFSVSLWSSLGLLILGWRKITRLAVRNNSFP